MNKEDKKLGMLAFVLLGILSILAGIGFYTGKIKFKQTSNKKEEKCNCKCNHSNSEKQNETSAEDALMFYYLLDL